MRLLTPPQAKLLQLARDGHVAAEIARREEQRWLAEDDSVLALLLGLLGRLQAELDQAEMAPDSEPDSAEATEAVAKLEEMVTKVENLIEALERLVAREEDEKAGVEYPARSSAVVRPQHKLELSPPKQARASSRGQRTSGDAAVVSTTGDEGWKFGRVGSFNQINLSGVVIYNGSKGSEEAGISAVAFRRSGLTNLFPGQLVECRIFSRVDGYKDVTDLKLAPERSTSWSPAPSSVAMYRIGPTSASTVRRSPPQRPSRPSDRRGSSPRP